MAEEEAKNDEEDEKEGSRDSRGPFHEKVGACIAGQDKAQTPIESDRPVELRHVEPQGQTHLLCFLRQIPDQVAPDSRVSIFRDEGDLRQPDLFLGPDDDQVSHRSAVQENYPLVRLGRYGGVVVPMRFELEPQECVLISLAPAEGLELLLPGAGVEAKEEGLVLGKDGPKRDGLDHGREEGTGPISNPVCQVIVGMDRVLRVL
jgi:hypothetical protein